MTSEKNYFGWVFPIDGHILSVLLNQQGSLLDLFIMVGPWNLKPKPCAFLLCMVESWVFDLQWRTCSNVTRWRHRRLDCRRRSGFTLRFHRGLPRLKNKSNRLSFFNFHENLNEGKWIPSKSWRQSFGLIWCIGTFLSALINGVFSTVF
jgi:hypothetical protein